MVVSPVQEDALVKRRRPTRRDLLVVVARLQDAIGRGIAAYDCEGSSRAGDVHEALRPAFSLAIEALSQDDPFVNSGPWSEP